MFYRLSGIADDVNKGIAGTGLKAQVGHTPELLQYVRVPLENGGAVALAAAPPVSGAWLIVWPKTSTYEDNQMAWPLDTDRDVLVKIFTAAVDNAVQGPRTTLAVPLGQGRQQRYRRTRGPASGERSRAQRAAPHTAQDAERRRTTTRRCREPERTPAYRQERR
jgi:hypothetical protein